MDLETLCDNILKLKKKITIKVRLIKKYLSSPSNAPVDEEHAQDWMSLAARYMVTDTSKRARIKQVFGCIILDRVIELHPVETLNFFRPEHLASFIPSTLASDISFHRNIEFLHRLIKGLSASIPPHKLRHLWNAFKPCLLTLTDPNPPKALPPFDTQIAILKLLADYPEKMVNGRIFRTQTLLRWLSVFPNFGPKQNEETGTNVFLFLRSLKYKWQDTSVNEVTDVMQSLFGFLAGAPIVDAKSPTGQNSFVNMIEPSPVLSLVAENIPNRYLEQVVPFISLTSTYYSNDFLETALSRMLQWPMSSTVSAWVIKVFEGICASGKFSILATVTRNYSQFCVKQITNERFRTGALAVAQRLLMGYQHSEDAFLEHLPTLVEISELLVWKYGLQEQPEATDFATVNQTQPEKNDNTECDSNNDNTTDGNDSCDNSTPMETAEQVSETKDGSDQSDEKAHDNEADTIDMKQAPDTKSSSSTLITQDDRKFLDSFGWFLFCQMYLHTGHSDVYLPLIKNLKLLEVERPPEEFLQSLIKLNAWQGSDSKDWEGLVGTSNLQTRKSSSMVGLSNLGNTCYMNSVIQSLFVSDSFKKLVYSIPVGARLRGQIRNRDNSNNYGSSLVFPELQKLFAHLDFSERAYYSPSQFLTTLPAQFQNRSQQDASEFAKFLLDHVSNVIAHSSNSTSSSSSSSSPSSSLSASSTFHPQQHPDKALLDSKLTPDRVFGGVLRSVIECETCHYRSVRVEPFSDLTLSVDFLQSPDQTDERNGQETTQDLMSKSDGAGPANGKSKDFLELEDCVGHFFRREKLSGSNSYLCSACGQKRDATKTMSVINSPCNLMVCFNRFRFDYQTLSRHKIMTRVRFPEEYKLPVVRNNHTDVSMGNENDNPANTTDGSQVEECQAYENYVLYAAVIHSGSSAQHGHYYAIGRRSHADDSSNQVGDKWYSLNDSRVTKSSFETLDELCAIFPNDVAYMLFYRRVSELDDQENKERINNTTNNPQIQRTIDTLRRAVNIDNRKYSEQIQQQASIPPRLAPRVNDTYASFRAFHGQTKLEDDGLYRDPDM